MKIIISCKLIVCHGGKVCLIKFANKGYFSVLILIKRCKFSQNLHFMGALLWVYGNQNLKFFKIKDLTWRKYFLGKMG